MSETPNPSSPIPRRTFLRRLGLASLAAGTVAGLDAGRVWPFTGPRGTDARARARTRAVAHAASPPTTTVPEGPELVTSARVTSENALPGTLQWLIAGTQRPHGIEGYTDRVSAVAGDPVTLFVNTVAPSFHVEAYRLGWYQGTGARLLWTSPEIVGRRQASHTVTAGTNMVECRWAPSTVFTVPRSWMSGAYLLKLVGSGGEQQYVPLTVRDDVGTAAYAIQNSVTTWQAYNWWGEYSLYKGPAGHGTSFDRRSRVVSFDRPYPIDWANGASDLLGNELPLILLAERLGLDVTYLTNVDVHRDPAALTRHHAFVSLGHDEYWSLPMRDTAMAARDAGVNLLFLGANACFRRIRLEDGLHGPLRRQVCYKVASEDPLHRSGRPDVTADWPEPPSAWPQSQLIGNLYQSNPVHADLVVYEPDAWVYAGTGAGRGDVLHGVVGTEFDAYRPGPDAPANLEVLAHSPLRCNGRLSAADMTWYTAPSGAGVFATGTNWWISKLTDGTRIPDVTLPAFPDVAGDVIAITRNVLTATGQGPAATYHPSTPNWQALYSPSSAHTWQRPTIDPGA